MKPELPTFKEALTNAFKTLYTIAPMLLAVIGLVGLFETFVTPEMLHSLFNGSPLYDTLVGTFVGGVSVGQPFLSYIIGGELLHEGVSLYAVTAFILSFVTLGLVQLPFEYSLFGLRFTVVRNMLALLFALLIAWATVITVGLFS
ncbi:MAG: permease [Campylobacterota bacterium]